MKACPGTKRTVDVKQTLKEEKNTTIGSQRVLGRRLVRYSVEGYRRGV